MVVTGYRKRSIYAQQNSFDWNFRLNEINSNNFEAGLSGSAGTGLIRYSFSGGKIYDQNNKFIDVYSQKPLLFEHSFYQFSGESRINSIPIARGITSAGSYDYIFFNVKDSGSIDVDVTVNGDYPNLLFSDIYAISGISGNITNDYRVGLGTYPFKIYDISSPQANGASWNFTTDIAAGSTYSFYTTGDFSFVSGDSIQVDFDTNFGPYSKTFPVLNGRGVDVGEAGGGESYAYFSLSLASGLVPITGNYGNLLYRLDYNTSNTLLNLNFFYLSGQVGNATVTATQGTTGLFSGWLLANNSGLCSGYLYGNNLSFTQSSYVLDEDNTGSVNFSGISSIPWTGYGTGQVTAFHDPVQNHIDGVANFILPTGFLTTGPYSTDLGGYRVTAIETGSMYQLWLKNQRDSSSLVINGRTMTGQITSTGALGKYIFSGDTYSGQGIVRRQVALSGIWPQYSGSYTGYIWKGDAYWYRSGEGNNWAVNGNYYNPSYIATAFGTIYAANNFISSDPRIFVIHKAYVPDASYSGRINMSGLTSVGYYSYYGNPIGATLWNDFIGSGNRSTNWDQYQNKEEFCPPEVITTGLLDWQLFTGNYRWSGSIGILDTPQALLDSQYYPTGTATTPREAPFSNGIQSFLGGTGCTFLAYQFANFAPIQSPNLVLNGSPSTPMDNAQLSASIWSGQMTGNFAITGYIKKGKARYYFTSGSLSGYYIESPTELNGNIFDNQPLPYVFNIISGSTYVATKVIDLQTPKQFTQNFYTPVTGYISSGYFNVTGSVTVTGTGTFSGFLKKMNRVWSLSYAPQVTGSYINLDVPPYYNSTTDYDLFAKEEFPTTGIGSLYFRLGYSGRQYDTNDGTDNVAYLNLWSSEASYANLYIDAGRADD